DQLHEHRTLSPHGDLDSAWVSTGGGRPGHLPLGSASCERGTVSTSYRDLDADRLDEHSPLWSYRDRALYAESADRGRPWRLFRGWVPFECGAIQSRPRNMVGNQLDD